MPTSTTDQLPLMSVTGVLAELERAGEAGLLTGDLARRFAGRPSAGGDVQRLLAEANTILDKQARMGNAVKSSWMEPSPHYHNAPSRRWFITDAGRAYLAAGGRGGIAERLRLGRRERVARREEARAAAGDRLAGPLAARDRAARNAVIRELHAEGILSLEDIGQAAGMTRERVRQIAKGG